MDALGWRLYYHEWENEKNNNNKDENTDDHKDSHEDDPVYSKDWEDPPQTTTCGTQESKESTLFYSSIPFNLYWQTKNPGLLRLWCAAGGCLQRVHLEKGWGGGQL